MHDLPVPHVLGDSVLSVIPVPRVLGDRTLATCLAGVAQLLPDGPLEESLAALTTDGPVVAT